MDWNYRRLVAMGESYKRDRKIRFSIHRDNEGGLKIADVYSDSIQDAIAEAARFFVMMPYKVHVIRARDKIRRAEFVPGARRPGRPVKPTLS